MRRVLIRFSRSFIAPALIITALCALVAQQSRAGSNQVTSTGIPLRWPNGTPNPFVINPGGVPNFTGPIDQLIVAGAIRDSFRAWTEVPGAGIHFTDGGLTNQTLTSSSDHINLITFQDNTITFAPGELAKTLVFMIPATGVITDADLAFNPSPQKPFSPVGGANTTDIIAVATHEIGHLLGLGHSGILDAIMVPAIQEDLNGVSNRRLSPDDATMISNLYPVATFAASTGSIGGTITDSQGAPVKSAHAIALTVPGGVPVASQLSGANGLYRIDGLPPGSYQLTVEPLDGPASLGDVDSFYANGRANFTTTSFGGLNSPATIGVTAGQTSSASVQLPSNPATAINTQQLGRSSGGGSFLSNSPLFVPRGGSYTGIATEASHSTNTSWAFTDPDVTTAGGTTAGAFGATPTRVQNFTIAAGAALVPSNMSLSTGTVASVMPGGIVVTVNPQEAVPLRDGAAFGTALAPGSFISIFGNDLAEQLVNAAHLPLPTSLGGVSVKIGNRFAPLFFVSPGQINAMVPFDVSGNVPVQVVTGPFGAGNSVNVNLAATSPGIFTLNQQGTGQGAILNSSDNSFAAVAGSVPGRDARPAHPNDIIVIFASGLGKTTPALASGLDSAVNGTAAPQSTNYPTVRIGGVVVPLDFSGLAPTFAGLYQINAHVPAGVTGNAVPVQITTFEGQTSNTATIAITP